ncbi:hypothetical protein [Streptomyces lavendulae]|uniref:hypothetical protein n=1 Tax=Streptomyces lavendulae TaxID=1914 RepID=UPI0024A11A7D|nr:hypothetical protein Sros01_80960 [Streptomyces roseochromogenus]
MANESEGSFGEWLTIAHDLLPGYISQLNDAMGLHRDEQDNQDAVSKVAQTVEEALITLREVAPDPSPYTPRLGLELYTAVVTAGAYARLVHHEDSMRQNEMRQFAEAYIQAFNEFWRGPP